MQFRSEQRNTLLIVAYLCAIVSGAAHAYFGAAWAFGAIGYPLPAPLPNDAFVPVLVVLGGVVAASSWAIAHLQQSTTAPDLRAQILTSQMQRITNQLHDTLGEQARLELGLTTSPASVVPRWRQHFGTEHTTPQPLPLAPLGSAPTLEAKITRAFDRFNGQLLILGAPGAGKTTLLLELARDLIARAQADATHPIPVLVNLSTWGSNPRPLERWLAEAMRDAVGTSKRFAQQLIAGDQVLLLLDGLDEVAPTQRAACVQAINTFLAGRMQQQAAVCCRMQEYEVIGEQLTFDGALQVEPLTEQQIADVLQAGGTKLAGVRQALDDEPRFRDLLTTPLVLNIVILAYSGVAAVQLAGQTPQELRRHLFAAYVERMLTRHNQRLDTRYRPKVQHWLAWLAHQMHRESTTDFRVGDMQPTMLKHQLLYQPLLGLGVGLLFALGWGLGWKLFGGLVLGLDLDFYLWRSYFWVNVGLSVGLNVGLLFGLFGGLFITLGWNLIFGLQGRLEEGLLGGLGWGLVGGLLGGLVSVLGWGLLNAMDDDMVFVLLIGLIGGLFSGVVFGMVFGLLIGLIGGLLRLQRVDVTATRVPNQTIRRSLQSGTIAGLVFGLVFGVGWGLIGGLVGGLGLGLIGGLLFGLLGGLGFGWAAVIQHYTLRFALWREGVIPLNYVRFLCQCHDALLLQRDGGIFRFRHPLLQDYFADLWERAEPASVPTNTPATHP